MRTAEKTRLKASNGESSRTRPVALRTKTVVEPCGFESLTVDIIPSSLVFIMCRLRRHIMKEKGFCEDTSRSGRGTAPAPLKNALLGRQFAVDQVKVDALPGPY